MSDTAQPSRRDLWIHWLLYPGHSLPTAAAPVLVAMSLAYRDHVFALLPAVMGFLASWLIHIGGLFMDNYQLLTKYPTVNEHPELTQALRDKTLTVRGLRGATITCFALAALTGPYLLDVAGAPVIAIGLLGMAGSLAYSTGPLPSGKFGLADPHFFVMFGVFAPAAAYYAQMASHYDTSSYWNLVFHHLPLRAFVVGLPLGALCVNILIIDDVRDREFDAAKGWRTGPLRFGMRWSRIEYVLAAAFAYIAPFWFWLRWGFDAWVLLPLLTVPAAVAIARKLFTDDSHDGLVPMSPPAALLCFGYAVLLAVGIAL